MAYADLQILMDKLKQLIYCNDIPMINNPSIVCERPQLLLLYEELGSMIQTLFIHEDQDLGSLEEVTNQRKRFKAAAQEAEDIVDLFLSTVHFRNNGYFPRSDVFRPTLHLEVVMRSIKSIKMKFMALLVDKMKMDSPQKTDRLQMQPAGAVAGTSLTKNSLGSKKVLEEIVVGLDGDIELIRDKLLEDRKELDVVSIVGMGGIGKTTLANKVFTDPFVVYHFHVRSWVTVSQSYENRDLLIQILSYIGVQRDNLEKANDCRLRELLHKRLMGKRYLIVIDDIWSIKAWDKLKINFPNDNIGSRILLTSRLTEVASHAKSDGFIHQLQYLTKEESWELLCGKVFQNNECPKWLIKPGKRIAKNCHGLPLSVVVIAGVLAKEARSKDSWEKIAFRVSSYIASDERGCLETLALSYHHLPLPLRQCFLYLGGFQEDSWILVKRLTWLWIAEGFIQEDGCQSLEEIAEGYLMDLVDRNLLIVAERKFNGDVRVCKVHDLVRELCIEKAEEERFFLRVIDSALSSGFGNTISLSYAGLTLPLRRCFLYLGRIRKNSWIHVHVLIRSWIRQGFIQEDESGSLEEIAEGYLMHLVYKNLIIIDERKYDGDVLRVCKVHDLAWKICFGKTKSTFKNFQKFLKRTADVITTDKQRRVFTNKNIYIVSSAYLPIPSIRSLTCFHDETSLFYDTPEYFRSFALLRVLNLPNCKFIDFPPEIGLLVHLRYLAIEKSLCLSPICNLWSLQTLIIRRSYSFMVLPGNISNLVNLRHLWSNEVLYLPSIRKPMNLQTISNVVMLGDGVGNFQKCFPIVKKLACAFYSDAENDFESLRYLETLKLTGSDSLTRESTDPQFLRGEPNYQKNNIRFPTTLKKLTLVRCHLPWSDMSIIQSLPNLEALRLIDNAFDGTLWETGDEQFQQLKFLTLKELHIRRWEASCINFPCLKRFRVVKCNDLEEIPLEIGDISTLEFLEADGCGASLNTSLGNIRQEQDDTGNYELKIKVDGRQLLSCVPKHED